MSRFRARGRWPNAHLRRTQYTRTQRMSALEVVTVVFGLIGGLSVSARAVCEVVVGFLWNRGCKKRLARQMAAWEAEQATLAAIPPAPAASSQQTAEFDAASASGFKVQIGVPSAAPAAASPAAVTEPVAAPAPVSGATAV